MKKVIDASYFQDPSLEDYLRSNKRNKVVFTDHACMEAYKGDAIKNLQSSLQIVSKYPRQVIVLKSTREIIALQNSSASGWRSMEDRSQTLEFRQFCAQLQRAIRGNSALAGHVLKLGEVATEHFNTVALDAQGVQRAIQLFEQSFHREDLNSLRRKTDLSDAACEKIFNDILA